MSGDATAFCRGCGLQQRLWEQVVVILGNENWPFPIPLVQEGTVWRFDTKDGEKEILERRIGRNELKVIEVCRAYVEAQREYAAKERSGGDHAEYAQHALKHLGQARWVVLACWGWRRAEPLGSVDRQSTGRRLFHERQRVRALLRLLLQDFYGPRRERAPAAPRTTSSMDT